MAGHAVLHRRPDVLLKARESGSRLAALRIWRLDEQKAAFVGFWAMVRYESWVTEEKAKACRRRALIEDNPTSG